MSQKNSKQIRKSRRTGKRYVGSNDGVLEWRRDAEAQLAMQWNHNPIHPKIQCSLTIRCYLAKGQTMDCDGIASAPMDALEKAGILANDAQVNPLHVERRRDWDDPRVELVLEPLVEVKYGKD